MEHRDGFSEEKIKAAYIYNFLGFVEWPVEVSSVMKICVYGSSEEYVSAFNAMPTKTKAGIYLNVQYMDSSDKLEVLDTCKIIFITEGAISSTREILSLVKTALDLRLVNQMNSLSKEE